MTNTEELQMMIDTLEEDGFEEEFNGFVDSYCDLLQRIDTIKDKVLGISSSTVLMSLLEMELTERRDEHHKSLLDV